MENRWKKLEKYYGIHKKIEEYMYIYIYIYIYIHPLSMFHIFSPVCFLIYSVNSRSGHDRSQTFGSTLHVSGSKMSFR